MGRPDYSKVDSTPQERDLITRNYDYDNWLFRMQRRPPVVYAEFPGGRTRLAVCDVLVEIEIMKPGVTSIAADLEHPYALIGDDRMEMHIQSNKAGYR